MSHADLFGEFSVGFDPIAARRLGIVPTNYYSRNDIFGSRYETNAQATPGLNMQIIQRLSELREMLVAISLLERAAAVEMGDASLPDAFLGLGLVLPHNPEILSLVSNMSNVERLAALAVTSTDRDPAVHLVSFIDMMLSLFQETDARESGEVLAFFQQREWRLIHHMRAGMAWYSLGEQPVFRNRLGQHRGAEIAAQREIINHLSGYDREEIFFSNCWILESVDGLDIKDYIEQIITPSRYCREVEQIARRYDCKAEIVVIDDIAS